MRIPKRLSEKDLRRFLSESESWIQKKLTEVSTHLTTKKVFIPGEEFFVLGKPVCLCLTPKAPKKLQFDGEAFFTGHSDKNKIQRQLVKWYRLKAEEVFQRRLQHFSARMELQPTGLQVKEYSARWGTCFNDGQIALNWRLIMPPLSVLDYVVVHELAHLRYNGHGKRFWALVEKHDPRYREAKQLLNEWNSELYSF